MPGYTSFQLLSYHVPTDKNLLPGDACALSQASEDAIKDLLPKLSSDDARNRVRRLIAVAEKSVAKADNQDATLKVFMAPEFYFQPWDQAHVNPNAQNPPPPRAYSSDDMVYISACLSAVFRQACWDGWLLVLGTVIWKAEATDYLHGLDLDENKKIPDEYIEAAKGKYVYLNTALVIEGGDHAVRTMQKTNYADFDGIKPEYRPHMKNPGFAGIKQKPREYIDKYLQALKKFDETLIFFQLHDFYLTLEICADHASGVAKRIYNNWLAGFPNDQPTLKLQLLTCCGMELQGNNMLLQPGHYALRTDGISWEIPRRSEICKVTAIGKVNQDDKADCRQMESIFEPESKVALENDLALDVSNVKTRGVNGDVELKNVFTQEVYVYKPLPFAQAANNNDANGQAQP